MWLKLTREDNNKQQLYNMDHIKSISQQDTCTYLELDFDAGFHVKESLAEIELMLMGRKLSAPDPRERNVIVQRQITGHDGVTRSEREHELFLLSGK